MTLPAGQTPSAPDLRAAAEAQLTRVSPAAADSADSDTSGVLHELRVHQIELEMQNETLRQAQSALEESRDRYVELYEFAPVGYLTLTTDGLIADVNLTAVKLLGVERKALLHRSLAAWVVPEDGDRWRRFCMHVKKPGVSASIELTLKHGAGHVFEAQLEREIERFRWRNHLYPLNQIVGPHIDVPRVLESQAVTNLQRAILAGGLARTIVLSATLAHDLLQAPQTGHPLHGCPCRNGRRMRLSGPRWRIEDRQQFNAQSRLSQTEKRPLAHS